MQSHLAPDNKIDPISSYSIEHYQPNCSSIPDQVINDIYEIELECFAEGMACSKEKIKKDLKVQHTILIRIGLKAVGTVSYEEDENCMYISNLSVLKKYQHQGIGRKLLEEVQDIAERKNLPLELDTPPRNQVYYSKFGFKTHPSYHFSYEVFQQDEKNKKISYPLTLVKMRNDLQKNEPQHQIDPTKIKLTSKKLDQSEPQLNPIDCIKAIKQLAIFANKNTSYAYRFSGSNRKSKAFNAIKEELDIQLSSIQQKPSLSLEKLAGIILAIIKNAMTVRGSATIRNSKLIRCMGLFSNKTTSGNNIISLLSGEIKSNFISDEQVTIIKKLLHHFYDINLNKNSYNEMRNQLFSENEINRGYSINPYLYLGISKS